MSGALQGKKAAHPGPHWEAGITPINVGSYTNIKPVIDESRCIAPCRVTCPAETDIQGFVSLIADGQYREALKLIKQTNPLPLVCGRVCPSFCEVRCSVGTVDEPVAINALERFVADYDQSTGVPYVPEIKPATGHKVAIIGGGPAGLSAAYYLAVEGHEVLILEANSQLGGMLRYGIPEYRLPKAVLDREIATIVNLCHEIHYNASLGQDFTIEGLKKRGYEAIFIGIGAQFDERMGIEGESLPGVLSWVRFLRDVAVGKKVNLGGKVVVIGGGNTAVDAARTAMRLGAEEVTILYRRSREEMTAIPEEVEGAEQEGIRLHFLAAPVRVTAKDGRIDSTECVRMMLGEPDGSGRRRPQPITGSEFTLKTDIVIVAIGQTIDTSVLPKEVLNPSGYIEANEGTMETALEGVFAGGDCASEPATVVEAITAGRKAATSISQYLSGQPIVPSRRPRDYNESQVANISIKAIEQVKHLPRVKMPVLLPAERKRNFNGIKLGFTDEMAKKETERCLQCGSCLLCWLFCPDGAISLRASDKKPTIDNNLCKGCGICAYECPLKAIEMLPLE